MRTYTYIHIIHIQIFFVYYFWNLFCLYILFFAHADALAKSLSDLMELVKLLREDIANQRQEISYLRRLLENCAGCKEPSSSSLRLEPTCRNANPCYPGEPVFAKQYMKTDNISVDILTYLYIIHTYTQMPIGVWNECRMTKIYGFVTTCRCWVPRNG